MPSIAIVCTSSPTLGGHKTGLWLEECASPYYTFHEAGYEVILASPLGGPVPLDAASLGADFLTEPAKKFLLDPDAMGSLSHTTKLADVDTSALDAIFFCGGHGTCAAGDFVDNASVKAAVEGMYSAEKVVAAVCHGPMCLPQCFQADGTTPLVKGLKVAAFTDSEEEAVGLTGAVPFLLESKLKELGALHEKADDWHSKVCVDGKLVTGQNPQSSEDCAKAVVELLTQG
jgi:putative intracellular protease/amidase